MTIRSGGARAGQITFDTNWASLALLLSHWRKFSFLTLIFRPRLRGMVERQILNLTVQHPANFSIQMPILIQTAPRISLTFNGTISHLSMYRDTPYDSEF